MIIKDFIRRPLGFFLLFMILLVTPIIASMQNHEERQNWLFSTFADIFGPEMDVWEEINENKQHYEDVAQLILKSPGFQSVLEPGDYISIPGYVNLDGKRYRIKKLPSYDRYIVLTGDERIVKDPERIFKILFIFHFTKTLAASIAGERNIRAVGELSGILRKMGKYYVAANVMDKLQSVLSDILSDVATKHSGDLRKYIENFLETDELAKVIATIEMKRLEMLINEYLRSVQHFHPPSIDYQTASRLYRVTAFLVDGRQLQGIKKLAEETFPGFNENMAVYTVKKVWGSFVETITGDLLKKLKNKKKLSIEEAILLNNAAALQKLQKVKKIRDIILLVEKIRTYYESTLSMNEILNIYNIYANGVQHVNPIGDTTDYLVLYHNDSLHFIKSVLKNQNEIDYEIDFDLVGGDNLCRVFLLDNYRSGMPLSEALTPGNILEASEPFSYKANLELLDLMLTLSWDTNNTDIDLHLVPHSPVNFMKKGIDCCYKSKKPKWGNPENNPELDIDDRDGYGPENIIVKKLKDGEYYVIIHNYKSRGVTITNANLTMRIGDKQPVHFGPIRLVRNKQEVQVIKLTVRNGEIQFDRKN